MALGGNALQKQGEAPTAENERERVEQSAEHLVRLIEEGNQLVLTHGNGPQVGRIMLQNEMAASETPPMPMDVCGAMSQGMIGYNIQGALQNRMNLLDIDRQVVTLVTQVVVDRDDQAFHNPSKPVGVYYSQSEAERIIKERGYTIKKDSNRGWRRVVPSPLPKEIVELDVIKRLVAAGVIVVTAGGGGIPVIRENGYYRGVEAVIDKDYASARLADDLGAQTLMMLTEVEHVYLNFGEPGEERLTRVTSAQLKKYRDQGHFAPGSMLPKVNAALNFVSSGEGRKAIITSLQHAYQGFKDKTGTIIVDG